MTAQHDSETKWLRDRLPKTALDYLDGNDRHSGGSWSTLTALAMYCLSEGMFFEEFRHLIRGSEFVETTSLLRPGKREGQISDAWAKVEESWTPSAGREDIRKMVDALGDEVASHAWGTRTANTDRVVSRAILDHCHLLGTYSPVLSARFIAEQVSMGHATVARSMNRMIDLGLLSRVRKTEHGNWQYRVNLRWTSRNKRSEPKLQLETSSLVPSTCIILQSYSGPVPQHDAFVRSGLGQLAGEIWFRTTEPVTVAQVAQDFGISTHSARRYLDRLVPVGLASREGTRPVVYTMLDASVERLDEIARWCGTDGWIERQKETHQRQRDANEFLARGA